MVEQINKFQLKMAWEVKEIWRQGWWDKKCKVLAENDMGSEGDLEANVVGQEMQVLTKDVVALAAPEIIQEQVQVGGDVGEASIVDVNKIDANLKKTILMTKK